MDVTWLSLLVGFSCYITNLKASGKRCKTQDFRDSFENKALKGHLVKTEFASSEGHCESKCFLDDRCISYNYGIDANKTRQNMCELSDSDHVMHPSDLIGREKTVYRRAENNCKCPPFKVCKVNWLHETHQCECKKGFGGSQCNTPVTEATTSPASSVNPTTQAASGSYNFLGTGNGLGWSGAKEDCKNKGGNLPSIHSIADNAKVMTFYHIAGQSVWLGISKDYTGVYTWSNDKPVNFTNWKSNPAGSGNCGYMESSGKWGRDDCGRSYRYLCFS